MSPRYCKYCKIPTVHYELHDSFFCPLCNIWTEDKCGDEHCSYCTNRPHKPFSGSIHTSLMEAYGNIGTGGLLMLVDEYLEDEYSKEI